jgi:hypothetical protein
MTTRSLMDDLKRSLLMAKLGVSPADLLADRTAAGRATSRAMNWCASRPTVNT